MSKATVKYDWVLMKQEFFLSRHQESYVFLRQEYDLDANTNGAVGRRVKGWSNEKLELRRKALEKTKQKIVDTYVPSAQELANMHRGVINLIKMMIQKELTDCIKVDASGAQVIAKMPDIRMVAAIWKIIKTEKLEPPRDMPSNPLSPSDALLVKKLLDDIFED